MSSSLRVNTIVPSTGTAIGIGTASGNIDVLGHIVGHNTPNLSGINSVTANTFYGSGANLTGISVDSTKIETGNTKVETIDTGSDGHIKVTTEGTERLRITSNGSVAIGVNSPSDILHVGGNNAFIRVDRPNGNPGLTLIYNSTNSTRADIDVTTGGDLRFATNSSTERLRITSAGIIKCGTSATLKAEINNAVSGHQFISQCSDNNNGFEVYQQHGSTSSRNTLACYDNRGSGGAKQLSFAVVGDGNVSVPNGNVKMGSGYGINFHNYATSGNPASNLLDDYEEGTWSPNVGGNATYDIQWGYYIKIGAMVQCWGGLRTQPLGTGDARAINNLPFTALNSPGSTQTGGGMIVWHDNAPNNIINTPAIAVTPNTTNTRINTKTSGSGNLQDNVDFWQNNHRANFFITYRVTL